MQRSLPCRHSIAPTMSIIAPRGVLAIDATVFGFGEKERRRHARQQTADLIRR
jgi:hypothetical protein